MKYRTDNDDTYIPNCDKVKIPHIREDMKYRTYNDDTYIPNCDKVKKLPRIREDEVSYL